MVTHHVAAGTTIIALCNRDRGSRAAALHIGGELGLNDPRG
jgi:hypothetical protein